MPADLAARVRAWIAADPDADTRGELQSLLDAGDDVSLAARFAGHLQFGTAGLRGALGGGPNRMNVAVVRAASYGLARWLHAHDTAAGGVVVGYDHRHGSKVFARETAGVLAAAGIPVRLAVHAWPTPVTAYAVRFCNAAAGVMVTASHNPAPDNGYKVYDGSGSQIIPPTDGEIAREIEHAPPARDIASDSSSALVSALGAEMVDAYLDMAVASVPAGPRDLKIVYTPVHGVGLDVFRALWERAGFPPPLVVPEQAEPDPDFPTAPFPNPEEPGVLDLALDLARRKRADLVLANDPDADRLSVAVPEGRDFRVMSGNEVGAVLGAHMLALTAGDDRVVSRSIVSSRLLDRVADAAGVPCRPGLTGFKWISRAGDRDGRRLVFGYEEALGYAVTPQVRDKDGLTAALAMGDLAARHSVSDALDELFAAYGVHATSQWSMRFPDVSGAQAFTARVRQQPPATLGGVGVSAVVDYAHGAEGLPPADMVELQLADGARVLVRPSGTEPKVKCYFEVVLPLSERAEAETRLAALQESLTASVGTMPA